ncbi:uncharacterized protein LOC106156466 isoform X2 [Lingula anatina]|uniref:Uncharacterized protein LOC106156466 isoform X2 n=1 Tax=Lingula anatina TaxID=7574 RepID=A0A1S3HM53_LINAN|nr:uncharacterized protein LOC106156466 isoform X2 [Lingula anatina]|eukprot:XP_013387178.1 uncharacterized protein LOC106156466 isoform X2 [Lingula anatina]
MTAYPIVGEVAALEPPTMFRDVPEKNVTFLIDTSGSMYMSLEVVKDQLIEKLVKRAHEREDTMFNIIEFNSEVTQWADKMVKCSPQTVKFAAAWIKKLSAKTGTNTQDALLTAFSDQGCEAVYLVTDGLPDQHPSDILDHVSYASQSRPVHCIYLMYGNEADSAATEFLKDLSRETYGSFDIVTITQHGCVEKVTHIFESERAAARIIKSTEGVLYPNEKFCSLTTTLAAPPSSTVYLSPGLQPSVVVAGDTAIVDPIPAPRVVVTKDAVYHIPRPRYQMWSCYRPAHSWLKEQKQLQELDPSNPVALSPAAGALLIGNRVLARRTEDGLYYMGTVKSQVMADKFLVEFGPCKRGKFKDTVYQETHIYDIISYADALRHSIVTEDHVLAPWQHEGEKFGPGIVIDGCEKRFAEGTAKDELITVNFFNGRTEQVHPGVAVWIPDGLYERIKFELQMPPKARKTLEAQDRYPLDNLPGYPTSGPDADPEEYELPAPVYVDRVHTPVMIDRGLYHHPSYVPIYPVHHKHMEKPPSAVKSEEMSKLIPGTGLTKEQLNQKVMSQIMEHKMDDEDERQMNRERRNRQAVKIRQERERLLRRKQMQKEASLRRRSVSFEDMDDVPMDTFHRRRSVTFEDESDWEEEIDLDSGVGTWTGSDPGGYTRRRRRYSFGSDEALSDTEDKATQTRRSKSPNFGTRKTIPVESRPPWKYWNNEPSPALIGPPTPGPYNESATPLPLECREPTIGPNGYVEWSDTMYKPVNHSVKYDRDLFQESTKQPHPPSKEKTPHKDHQGRDFRAKRIMDKNHSWEKTAPHRSGMHPPSHDSYRQNLKAHMENERHRQRQAQMQVERTRDAKKQIGDEIRRKMDACAMRESEVEQRRIEAMRQRQMQREAVMQDRERAMQQTLERRQEVHTWSGVIMCDYGR